MDVDAAQSQGVGKRNGGGRDKSSITYFNYGKKGYFKRNYRGKKEWRLVPGKETATIEEAKKAPRVKDIAATSYTQDDLEDDIDQANAHEAALAELDTDSEILAESEASSKDPIVLANRLDATLSDLDGEFAQVPVPRLPPFEGISGRTMVNDDEGEVIPPSFIAEATNE